MLYRILRWVPMFVLAIIFIALIAFAIGLGNQLGHGLTEWTVR